MMIPVANPRPREIVEVPLLRFAEHWTGSLAPKVSLVFLVMDPALCLGHCLCQTLLPAIVYSSPGSEGMLSPDYPAFFIHTLPLSPTHFRSVDVPNAIGLLLWTVTQLARHLSIKIF
jgi:hypothetical protein